MQVVINDLTEAPLGSKPLVSQGNFYLNALTCLGCNPSNPPLADFLRLANHLEGNWLVASPIHWEATHNDAMIVATDEALKLNFEESALWFSEVAAFFKDHNMESFYIDPTIWLIKINHKPPISSQSPRSMLHKSIMPVLNTLDKTLYWQRLLTELQMYLSNHPLNLKRGISPVINGLWFWGEGAFNVLSRKITWSDDELFLSLPEALLAVKRLSESARFAKNHLVLLKCPDRFDLSHLKKYNKKNSIEWYWNNLAYLQQADNWWSKLWRS
jgi:hypothetical protein